MARYGAGVSMSGINTANTAYANLDQTGSTQRLLVRQVIVNIAVAPSTAPALYLARTSARGTQASTLAGLPWDENDAAALGTVDVCGTGASQPTFTNTNIMSGGGLAVTAGGAWVWTFFDVPIIIKATAGNGLAVCNANASGATLGTFKVSFMWDE